MADTEYTVYINDKIYKIPTMDDLCTILKEKFDSQERQINYWKDKYNEVCDKKWKDKELQEMKKQLEDNLDSLTYSFPVTKEEYEKVKEWINEHEHTCHPMSGIKHPRGGAIGGCYQWIFTPTSIGTFGQIKCNCGKSFTFQEAE